MAISKTTTAPTPNEPGRWVIPHFGRPSVLTWETFKPESSASPPGEKGRLQYLPSEPSGDLALIRIITAGIAGPDNLQRAGGYPNPATTEPGFTPGYDFVGEVVALGPDAQKAYADDVGDPSGTLAVGDHVCSMCTVGAHATHTLLAASELVKLKPTDDPVKMVALPLNYTTAFGMLRRAEGVDLKRGDSILIGSASGGIGTAIAELVKAFDMGLTMIGSCSASKFEYVKSMGVWPVDRKDAYMVDRVRAMTYKGHGVSVAYDAVGSVESLNASRRAAKDEGGKVISISLMGEILPDGSGMKNPGVSAAEILGSRYGEGMSLFAVDFLYYNVERQVWRKDFNDILEKARQGELEPTIAKLLPLRDAVKAHELLVSGTGNQGKLVYVVDADLAQEKIGQV